MESDRRNRDEQKPGTTPDVTPEAYVVAGDDRSALLLEYVCHPAKRNRNVTILVTIVLLVSVILVYLLSYSPFLAALSALILFGSLGSFYFPTRYLFYNDHLLVKTKLQTLRKEWHDYRSFYPDKNGVLLSPFGRPTRMENFRGLYVKFSGNRDQVMTIVRSKIDFQEEK
jgi:hypothetical protein